MFKYLPKKYTDLLFTENSICIGTLHGYRDMENKRGISDSLEGSYHDILNLDYFDQDSLPTDPNVKRNLKNLFNLDDIKGKVQFTNCSFGQRNISPNFLIYCFSYEKSKEVMNEFDGAECCFEIKKPSTFFQLITWELEKKLNTNVNFVGVFEVDYSEYKRKRKGENSIPIHPVLAKTEAFKNQKELRAIWEIPRNYIIPEPFYIFNILGLNKCCRIVEL